MLKINNISKCFGQKLAVKNFSMNLEQGNSMVLVGESGSGKTTLAKMIIGLEKPDSGEIFFESRKIDSLRQRSFECCTQMQYIFQDPYSALEPEFTLKQTLKETERICKRHGFKCMNPYSALEYIDSSMLEKINDKVATLSGGQRQKLCIARAIMTKPRLIIADESTSMLDRESSADIIRVLMRLKEEKNIAILSIVHEIDFEKDPWDFIVVMKDGEKIEEGEFKSFYKNAKEDYSREFIAALEYFKSIL